MNMLRFTKEEKPHGEASRLPLAYRFPFQMEYIKSE